MNFTQHCLLLIALALLVSCSDDPEPASRGDHVWKDQVQAYDKARQVEDLLKKEVNKNKDDLDQQTQ